MIKTLATENTSYNKAEIQNTKEEMQKARDRCLVTVTHD